MRLSWRMVMWLALALGVGAGCSDDPADDDPCRYPAEGCPCANGGDACCTDSQEGLACHGQWYRFTGCPCLPDPMSWCGTYRPPACEAGPAQTQAR